MKWIDKDHGTKVSVWYTATYKCNKLTSEYVKGSELRGKTETARLMTRRNLGKG